MEAIALGLEEFALPRGARPFRIRTVKPIASPQAAELSDSELFERFCAGEEAALTELFARHNGHIFRYCVKLVGDPAAAQDISQATWERVIDQSRTTIEVRNVPGFLIRIARNLALDYLKHRKIEASVEPSVEFVSMASELPEREQLVVDCLDLLPLASRELLILHYYSGYSFEEIAAMLGKKPNAIWTHASRARAELKQLVERRLSEER